MAKLAKAKKELNFLYLDLYLLGIKSEKDSNSLIVPLIDGKHPCEFILGMIERIRRVNDYLE